MEEPELNINWGRKKEEWRRVSKRIYLFSL